MVWFNVEPETVDDEVVEVVVSLMIVGVDKSRSSSVAVRTGKYTIESLIAITPICEIMLDIFFSSAMYHYLSYDKPNV